VLSISASGHKFGGAVCGTGWVVWRQRKDLSEHVAVNVSYLGGSADSYTLNFSRPASGAYSQFYKFMRLGIQGYVSVTNNMMNVCTYIRKELKSMMSEDGKTPIFAMLDDGDTGCLPVVAAMVNPELKAPYDDIDLQYELGKTHWYVSGYRMDFEHPLTKKELPIFTDQPAEKTMFRVVVKSNLTIRMAKNLVTSFKQSIDFLNSHGPGYKKFHAQQRYHQGQHPC